MEREKERGEGEKQKSGRIERVGKRGRDDGRQGKARGEGERERERGIMERGEGN